MPKELPFLKWEPAEYDNGKIAICSWAAQGVWNAVINHYWQRSGDVSEKHLRRKIRENDLIDELIAEGVLKIKKGKVSIKFLDDQLQDIEKTSEKRSMAANARWEKERKRKVTEQSKVNASALQLESKSNAIREEKIREEKITVPKPKKGESENMDEWKLFCDLYPIDPNYSKCQIQWCKVAPELWPKIIQDVKKRFPPGTNTQFVPNPDKYLRDMGWEMPIRQKSNDQPVDDGKPKNLPNNHPVMIAWKLNKDKYKQ